MATVAPRQLQLDPTLSLPDAFKQIETDRSAQQAGTEQFGKTQDTNIQNIYGQLQGDLNKSSGTIQSIYGVAAGNVGAARDRNALGAQAANAQVQTGIGDFASRMGMDSRATGEVQGRLAQQAQTFALRNQTSAQQRQGNLAQLGAGMASVAKLAAQASQQAEAQNRTDLSRRIQTEIAKVNASAASAKTGFTALKVQQTAKIAYDAQKAIIQAQKELMTEQRATNRANQADARANARAASSDARANARAAQSASNKSSGPSWMDKFNATNAENDRRFQRGVDSKAGDPAPAEYDASARQALGGPGTNGYTAFKAVMNGTTSLQDAKKQYKTPGGKSLNWGLIGDLIKNAP